MGNLTEFIRLQDATNLGKSVIDKIANYIRYCHRRRVAEETESKEEGGVDDCRDRASNGRHHGSYYEREYNTSHVRNGHTTVPAPLFLSAQ